MLASGVVAPIKLYDAFARTHRESQTQGTRGRAGKQTGATTIMNLHVVGRWLAVTMLSTVLGISELTAQSIGSLFQMMGGMDTASKLSSSLLQSSASDPRLAGLLGKANVSAVSPKLAEQMCSMLGGGCKAPLTDQQVAAGASKLDASQTKALGDNFGSALGNVTSNPLVKEGVSKAIAPKLGGIVGALI